MLGRVLNNMYRLDAEIAQSDCFLLFRGENIVTGHTVAVKTVRPHILEQYPDFADLFLTTARDCARLSHPRVNPIIEANQDQDILYAVTNHIQGATLSAYLNKHGVLSVEETAVIIAELSAAIGYIHSKGYIHRNIKPENILLFRGTFTPVLTDFGILKPEFLYEAAAGPRTIVAPEQLRGKPYAAASDIFVLGAIAYTMIAGHAPFQGADPEQRFSTPPMPIRAVAPDVPEHVDKAVMRALASDPGDRFLSAYNFALAFCKDILPHIEQILSPPPAARPAHSAAAPHTPESAWQAPAAQISDQRPAPGRAQGTCAVHPENRAVSFCIRCGTPLCPDCEKLEQGRPHCKSCMQAQHSGGLGQAIKKLKPPDNALEKAGSSLKKPLLNKELRRIAAVLIDMAVMLLAATPFTFIFWAISIKLMPAVHGLTLPVSYYLSLLFTGSIYYIGTHYRWGRTLGKHWLGLRVTHTDGRPLTLLGAIWRWIGFLTALIWAYIGFLLMKGLFALITLAGRVNGSESMSPGLALLLRAAAVVLFFILASGALITFVGKFKRGFHDILAGSIVDFQESLKRRMASESQSRQVPGPVHR